MIEIVQHKRKGCPARTLSCLVVSETRDHEGQSSRTHENGWTVSGVVKYDYYRWVNDFVAKHPVYGTVRGNFESVVYATSKKAYKMFTEAFDVVEWDYQSI